MKQAVQMLMISLFTIYMWIWQINLQVESEAHYKLKEAIEAGAHDAALQNIEEQVGKGKIVFDQNLALLEFKQTVSYYLKLNNTGSSVIQPLNNSFYQDPIKIVYTQYFDDSNIPTFPFLYSNPTYKINELIKGPSVLYVVETKTPLYFTGVKKDIRKAVVYEYPVS